MATPTLHRYPYLGTVLGLCGRMIQRAMLAVAYVTGRASHAKQTKGDVPDNKGILWSSSLGVGREANNLLLP